MRQETRYKAVVIPRLGNKYIVVRDKKSKDLTFVVGGCKMRESDVMCAVRELSEETHGSIVIDPRLLSKPSFYFTSKNRTKSEKATDEMHRVEVTMLYNVFIFDLNDSWSNIKRNYETKKFLTNEEKETNGIHLMTCKELENSTMWDFMKQNVLKKLCRW